MHRATTTSQTILRRTLSTSLLQSPSSATARDQPYINSSRSSNRCGWISRFSLRPLFRYVYLLIILLKTHTETIYTN